VVGRPGLIVFSEVKTRRSRAFGEPSEAVTAAKQARLRRLAAEYLRVAGRGRADDAVGADVVGRGPVEVRFDVVSILGSSVEVLEGAF
jgi:putative endonuclease